MTHIAFSKRVKHVPRQVAFFSVGVPCCFLCRFFIFRFNLKRDVARYWYRHYVCFHCGKKKSPPLRGWGKAGGGGWLLLESVCAT